MIQLASGKEVVSSLVKFVSENHLFGIPERVRKRMKVEEGQVPVFSLGNGNLLFKNKEGEIDFVHFSDCAGASLRRAI